jgi:hypothetical protein
MLLNTIVYLMVLLESLWIAGLLDRVSFEDFMELIKGKFHDINKQ